MNRRKRSRPQRSASHTAPPDPAAFTAAASAPVADAPASSGAAAQDDEDGDDDLSLAGLISDGEEDVGDPAAAAEGHQFYARVDRERAAEEAAPRASDAPAAASSRANRRKRSRPQRSATHTDAPAQPAPAQPAEGTAAEGADSDVELDSDSGGGEPPPRRRHRPAQSTGSALQDAIIEIQNRERANSAAAQQAARRRSKQRAEKAAAAAAELERRRNMHIVLVASREPAPGRGAEPGRYEAALLTGTLPAPALRRVLLAEPGQGPLGARLARVARDGSHGDGHAPPQAHAALSAPPEVLTALLELQEASWVYLHLQTDALMPQGEASGDAEVRLTASVCFARLGFEDATSGDTASMAPAQEAEWYKRRRALARKVKRVMLWARPEQFEAARSAETTSSSSEEEEAAAPKAQRKSARKRFDARSLYPKLSAKHKAGAGLRWPQRPDHALLRSELRHYQRAAAEWMIERENADTSATLDRPHPLWSRVTPLAGAEPAAAEPFYYQPAQGWLSQAQPPAPPEIAGGILADEMGLGKTVELLYCVLHHPKPQAAAAAAANTGVQRGTGTEARPAGRQDLAFSVECDDTQRSLRLGSWWHRRGSDEDLCPEAYSERLAAGQLGNAPGWLLVKQAGDLHEDLPLYLDSDNVGAYSGGDATKVPLLTLLNLILDALENLRDESQPWRVRSEIFQELPERQKYRKYYATIAQPIAFSTIRERVSQRHYTSLEGFQQDVRLMVANAKQFNLETSQVVADAVAIESSLGHLCRRCDRCRHIPPPGQGYTRRISDDDSDESDSEEETAGPTFLCAAHWAALPAVAQASYSRDLRDDGQHVELTCCCCKSKRNVPADELPEDGVGMDVVEWYCKDCERDIFFAPAEGADGELIESSATLIVCPSAICQQWVNEIAKHVTEGRFRVHVYNGLRSGERTTAKRLASQHIVITTYDVLRQEVYHSAAVQADGQDRMHRYRKKHRVVPTPLTALRWWRVCLDEAQMVHNGTAQAAQMAAQLPTIHRWCVTGTPIAHGLEDLYGLLRFLQAQPLDDRWWWLNAIKKPCEALVPSAVEQYHDFFCGLMWRSARVDVADQLRLPQQHEHKEILEFSDIEKYYYERQHRECLVAAKDVLRKYQDQPSDTVIDSKRWAQPFLRLRQACCHHQIGQASKTFLNSKSTAQRPLTMAELTDRLLAKAKVEAEEAQRLMLAAMNGLAALLLLDDTQPEQLKHKAAVDLYTDVLRIAEEHIERYSLKTDDLQRIHASINLSLLTQGQDPDGAAKLRESALSLRKNYQRLERSDFEVAKLQLGAARKSLEAARPEQHFVPTADPWWTRAASVLEETGRSEEFVQRLHQELAELGNAHSRDGAAAGLQFRDMRGLVYVLQLQLGNTWKARVEMTKTIEALSGRMSDEDARLAGNCSDCRPWGKGPTCAHCKAERGVILSYEQRLYSADRDKKNRGADGADDEGAAASPARPQGGAVDPQLARLAWNMKEHSSKKKVADMSRSPAEPEVALAALLRFLGTAARNHPAVDELREAGAAHIKALVLMKKEFEKLREVWLAQREVL